MTPLCSITCTDKDHVKPSVLGPSATSLVMGSRYYGPDNAVSELTSALKKKMTDPRTDLHNAG